MDGVGTAVSLSTMNQVSCKKIPRKEQPHKAQLKCVDTHREKKKSHYDERINNSMRKTETLYYCVKKYVWRSRDTAKGKH